MSQDVGFLIPGRGSSLANGPQSLSLGTDGVPASIAPAANLGALQSNVASQYMSGNNMRGYVRITVSGVAVAGGLPFCLVQLSGVLSAQAYIQLSPIIAGSAQYGDSIAVGSFFPGPISAWLTQVAQSAPSSFFVACSAALAINSAYALIYSILE